MKTLLGNALCDLTKFKEARLQIARKNVALALEIIHNYIVISDADNDVCGKAVEEMFRSFPRPLTEMEIDNMYSFDANLYCKIFRREGEEK